jgi:hypothetical protein
VIRLTSTAYQATYLSVPNGALKGQERFGVALQEYLRAGFAAATAVQQVTVQGRHMDSLLAGVRAAGMNNAVLTDFQGISGL